MKDKAPKTKPTMRTTSSAEERGHGPEGPSSKVSRGEISTVGGVEDRVLFTPARDPNRYLGYATEVLTISVFGLCRKKDWRTPETTS
jgi:hypothetical protein